MREINALEASELLEEGALLVDVREPHELEAVSFDVKNVINIPLSEIETRYKEIATDKKIIVACRAGIRSNQAIQYLMHFGNSGEALFNLQGGIIAWQQNGLKTK